MPETPGSAFHAEATEVWRISNAATQAQRQFALYWADDPGKTPTPAGHWVFITTDPLQARKASLSDAAQTHTRLNLAIADAVIAAWHTKQSLDPLRPVTFVQLFIDSNWLPGLMDTSAFHEYPSGDSVQSSAAAAVLGAQFGATSAFTDQTHNDRVWAPRQFASFKAAVDEAALSRLYAGIHFRSGVAGSRQ